MVHLKLKKGRVLLLLPGDFGIARMMENTFDMAQTCCGTPCYLSPELCQDMPYSSKADVWVSLRGYDSPSLKGYCLCCVLSLKICITDNLYNKHVHNGRKISFKMKSFLNLQAKT